MLKILLYTCASLLVLAVHSQPLPLDSIAQSDMISEDSNRVITDFIASVNDSKVILNWKVGGNLPDFFSIERSDNGKSYEVVTVLNKVSMLSHFQWTDEAAKKGRSFYRIRYAFNEGPSLYSKAIPVSIAGYIAYKFYPNPVDHILIVRSDVPVDVQISDGTGKVRITESRTSGLHTINVSTLEKGIYLIRLSNKLTNVMSQEKLIKN